MRRHAGSRIATNRVYSSNVHGEAFKIIPPDGHLHWEAKVQPRIHPKGHLKRSQLPKPCSHFTNPAYPCKVCGGRGHMSFGGKSLAEVTEERKAENKDKNRR